MNQPDDPGRLAEAAPRSPLGELFDSAARDLPSDQQLARLAAQLGPVLDSAPSAPKATSSATGASGLVKLAVVVSALAAFVGAGLALRHSSHTADAPSVAPQAPPALATPPSTPTAAEPVIEPATSADHGSPSATPEPASATSATSAKSASQNKAPSEATLLEQARRALDTSPSYALQLANQHRARFPNGVLTQEREVIAIEALRRLHRSSEAEQRATGFSQAFPGSAHQRRVDEASP